MREEKWIWFDMDGTIADLYSVDGWLEDLLAFNTRPYEQAKIMYNQLSLLEVMAELKKELRPEFINRIDEIFVFHKLNDNEISQIIISWGSKARNEEYDEMVTKAKKEWLEKTLLNILLDKVIVTQYGVCKADTCRPYGYGILVDDEKPNRDSWDLGETINANENILKSLWELVK